MPTLCDDAEILNLVDLLLLRTNEADHLGFRYLAGRDGTCTESMTFGELDRRARALARVLVEQKLTGQNALLCYPPGLEFMVGLFGSLYAGLVAVPAYPPRAHKTDTRLASMAASCQAGVVLTTQELCADQSRLTSQMPILAQIPWIPSDRIELTGVEHFRPFRPRSEDLAVLQYTSGSTGDPKGVMLTHRCILHNIAGISQAMRLIRGSIGVSWLPAFHDMGLIGNLLGAIWYPGCLHVLSPMAMLQDPFRWLEAVSRTRAYISGGPCFAFEQCLKRITPEQRKQLDLSAWKVAYVGAEPISPRILDEFASVFRDCGFRPESFYPCFGLAEASLMVTGVQAGAGAKVCRFDSQALEQDRALPAQNGRALVGSGKPILGLEVEVVDPLRREPRPDGHIGEIWVRGPSVASGYYQRPEATQQTFGATLAGDSSGTWMRTGDLGFFHQGELFIAGRLKDVLILRGRNYYPQDIEEVVQVASSLLKPGGGAAFTVESEIGARLVLVYEVGRSYKPGQSDVYQKARSAIAEEFGIELSELVLIRTGTLPRTSSGKVARRETKQRFVAEELDIVERFVAEEKEEDEAPGLAVASIQDWLRARLARQLGLQPGEVDLETPFANYGLDSVAIVQIASDLERWLGKTLSPTLLYSAPTIATLARALGEHAPRSSGQTSELSAEDTRIALVGIACRLPGAQDSEAFWQLLRQGRSAIRDLPAGRWLTDHRVLTTTRGGYLDEVYGFDAPFFSVSSREAPWIDPQHRLLLETAYHALEDAGWVVDRLAGSSAGVFVGISSNDYGKLLADHAGAEMYLATGNACSMAAHRLSYHLDLHGPSVSVDTACSSSLTAVHLACQALRLGECDVALAAGVNLILTPDISEALSRAQMLSPSARCKTFDASADGYVRGEGVGVVVLKPLAHALRDGDPIYAVIEASAVNQDGRSNGITAPNGRAQVELLRRVLARAGRKPDEISYLETHGTGTPLGDPIEFDALREALGEASLPCALGAVKTNLGHLEAAAGIAGLIKTALQLHHGEVVPIVDLGEVNPLIQLEGSRFYIPRECLPWKRAEKLRLAGVSSFGFGGSNAHVLLSEAPVEVENRASRLPRLPAYLIPLSARSERALRDQVRQLVAWLRRHPVSLDEVAHTLALGRVHHSYRLSVTAHHRDELVEALERWEQQGRDTRVQTGKVLAQPNRIAFLYTGQGAAFPGMVRVLSGYPVFEESLNRYSAWIQQLAGWSLQDVFEDATRLEQTEFAQPALLAFEMALTAQWRDWGIEPVAVLGHSAGEIAAACAAGILDEQQALKLALERGRAMQACPPGAMLACLAAPEQVDATLLRYDGRVRLAACNGPRQCVLAGDPGSIAAVAMELAELGIESKRLPVSRAFHSPLIEPALQRIEACAAELPHQTARIPLVTNKTGEVVHGLSAPYWVEQARATVQFEKAIHSLHRLGITHYLEIGPAMVLARLGASCLPGSQARWLGSLCADQAELLSTAGRLHVEGVSLDWAKLAGAGRRIHLPGYPFQHRTYGLQDLPRVKRATVPETDPVQTAKVDWKPCSNWAEELIRRAPAFDRLTTLVTGAVDAAWQEQSLTDALRLRPEFDRLAGLYLVTAFAQLGWRPALSETFTLSELADRFQIAPYKMRLLRRLTQLAAEDGWLEIQADLLRVRSLPPSEEAEAVYTELRSRYPEFEVELKLAHHCAGHLAAVLQGRVDPLQVLFDGEAARLTAEIYSRAPVARFYNALLTRAVHQLIEAQPSHRPLRILEVGAGTGGTTQALLPVLPAERTEYVFTDVSPLFLARAREHLGKYQYQGLQFRLLDLESDPADQGFASGQFDLIVASNVLHATADLRKCVRHVRQMLAPGGLLVLLEGTGPRRLLDLVFGLTEGWWKFVDDRLRTDYPLLSPTSWRKLLLEEGFDTVVALPDSDPRLPDPDQVVLLARIPVEGCVERSSRNRPRLAVQVLGADTPLRQAFGEYVDESLPAHSSIVLPNSEAVARELMSGQVWHVSIGAWPTTPLSGVMQIDLDPDQSVEEQAAILAEAVARADGQAIVAYREDQRYVPSTTVKVEEAPQARAVEHTEAPSREALLAASAFERRAVVESYLRAELGRLLGSPISEEEMDHPVQALGLDSLMAIQVRNRVESTLGVSLSLVDFLKGMRVRQLVDGIVEQLASAATAADSVQAHRVQEVSKPGPATLATDGVRGLSESEVDSLLVSLLESNGPEEE